MRVAVFTSWFPYKSDRVFGIFVLEHILAIKPFVDEVEAFHVVFVSGGLFPGVKISRHEEQGVPVTRVELRIPRWMEAAKKLRDGLSGKGKGKPASGAAPAGSGGASQSSRIKERLYAKMLDKLAATGKRFDVVHAYVAYPSAYTGMLYARRTGAKFVFTEVASNVEKIYGHGGDIRSFVERYLRPVVENADLVVTVSAEELKQYAALGVVPKNHRVIHTIYDGEVFHYDPSKKHTDRDVRYFVFCGLLADSEQKGMQYLIPAVAGLPESDRKRIKIRVIGYGSMLETYKNRAAEMGVAGQFDFLGRKTLREIAGEMQGADFFTIPSIDEGMPCVLIEAMACGLPVVGSRVGGIPEMVTGDVGLLVPAHDAKALSEAIRKILDGAGNYDGKAISQKVTNSSYTVYGKNYGQIYRELAG